MRSKSESKNLIENIESTFRSRHTKNYVVCLLQAENYHLVCACPMKIREDFIIWYRCQARAIRASYC